MSPIIAPAVRQSILRNMLESRYLDERLLLLARSGQAFFWTGGPGEEAFNTCLGSFLRLGKGPEFDFLLPHYRSSGIALSCGERSIDFIRQMLGRDTDPFSRGRNFGNHFVNASRNLGPVSSPVNSQLVFALGTARAQLSTQGVTVVVCGDASTHSGDFASLLIWASRPGNNLPILIVVTNNGGGISTSFESQHSELSITKRAVPFGISAAEVDGLSVDESYRVLAQGFEFVRRERRPFLVEAHVSRLWGHSSSSGVNRDPQVEDPLGRERFPAHWQQEIRERLKQEVEQVLLEPPVAGESGMEHVWGAE